MSIGLFEDILWKSEWNCFIGFRFVDNIYRVGRSFIYLFPSSLTFPSRELSTNPCSICNLTVLCYLRTSFPQLKYLDCVFQWSLSRPRPLNLVRCMAFYPGPSQSTIRIDMGMEFKKLFIPCPFRGSFKSPTRTPIEGSCHISSHKELGFHRSKCRSKGNASSYFQWIAATFGLSRWFFRWQSHL